MNPDDLNRFNCSRCGFPAYAHQPPRATGVCEQWQGAKVVTAELSSEAASINYIESRMPEEERAKLFAVLAEVRKAFVLQWARLVHGKDPHT